jgi:serine/threonine protein kinase
MPLTSGMRLGPYEIGAPLGAGGMGEVYRARDPRLERDVAIKVLPSEVAADPDRLRRFEQEARAAAALNHSNILALYDIGSEDGLAFIVTELLEGRTLRHVLEEERLSISRSCARHRRRFPQQPTGRCRRPSFASSTAVWRSRRLRDSSRRRTWRLR